MCVAVGAVVMRGEVPVVSPGRVLMDAAATWRMSLVAIPVACNANGGLSCCRMWVRLRFRGRDADGAGAQCAVVRTAMLCDEVSLGALPAWALGGTLKYPPTCPPTRGLRH